MKVLIFLGIICCASANQEVETTTAYGYIQNIGIPLAKKIYHAELKLTDRIIGGTASEPGQIPYQVGLLSKYIDVNGTGVCGGSLVSPNRVITAAHCWYDGKNQAHTTTVVMGSTMLFFGGTRMVTSKVVTHPDWTPSLIRNDVAVIYLPDTVTFSRTISPVALPSGSELLEDFSGETATASGYGLTASNGGISSDQHLSHVELRIIKNWVCRLAFPLILQDSNMCTSGLSGPGTCQGDSGSPLVVERNNRTIVVGITSFGSGFGCESRLPAAYTRVTSFIDFIQEHLQNVSD